MVDLKTFFSLAMPGFGFIMGQENLNPNNPYPGTILLCHMTGVLMGVFIKAGT